MRQSHEELSAQTPNSLRGVLFQSLVSRMEGECRPRHIVFDGSV